VWRIAPAGDQALLVTLGTAIDPSLLGEVLALERALMAAPPSGLVSMVPAYASLSCRYDPALTSGVTLERHIQALDGRLEGAVPSGPVVEIPTRYDGPDLADVAIATRLTPAEVVDRHASQDYLVYCVGFAPGFTYCGSLPEELAVPRRASPRQSVVAGAVAIAGRQTGIYAVESPGGWNLIGRTTESLFDAHANPPARFKPGDRLRFVPQR
jgi:inhibitor of KinA